MTLFRKNVILRDNRRRPLLPGLESLERYNQPNNENYITLVGSKAQINSYLQDAPILSERLRTLNDLPRFREIRGHMVRVQ